MPAGRRLRFLGVLLVCTWFLALPAGAADFYVNDGSTDGDVALRGCPSMPPGRNVGTCGSCERPCRTPQFLYDLVALSADDTVHLNTGVYTTTESAPNAPVLRLGDVTKAGEPGRWLTFTGPVDAAGRSLRDAEGRLLARIDGRGVASAGVLVNVEGIRIQALGLTSFSGDLPNCGSGIVVRSSSGSSSYSLRRLAFWSIGGACASAIDVWTPNATCRRCEILDNQMTHSPESSGAAVFVYGSHGLEIARNTIHDWGRVSNNAALYLRDTQKVAVHHNVVRNNAGAGVVLWNATATLLEHNTFRHNLQDDTGNGYAAELVALQGSDNRARNNIVVPRDGRGVQAFRGAPLEAAYNGYVLGSDGFLVEDLDQGLRLGFEAWQQAYGGDAGSLVVDDPGFVSDTDLHLRSSAGRWGGAAGWVLDADHSPFLDRGDPDADASQEPFPNGHRVNLGAYGNRPTASKTPLTLRAVAGDGQLGPVGETFPDVLVVQVTADDAVPIAALQSLALTYELVQGQATIEAASEVTDAQAQARLTVTPTGPGTVILEVGVADAPGIPPARFTLQARPDYLVAHGCSHAGALAPWGSLLLLGALGVRKRRARRSVSRPR